jgi:predicted amidophosphoribosyltransferase
MKASALGTGRNVIQCKQCGQPFQSFGGKLCPNCMAKIDDGLKILRTFLYSDVKSPTKRVKSVDELSKRTEVEAWVVLQLLREKRILPDYPLEGGMVCQYCHTPIVAGDACDDCKNKLASELFASKSSKLSPLNPGSSLKR